MKFFDLWEVLLSLIWAIAYGAICGVGYEIISLTVLSFKDVLAALPRAMRLAERPSYKNSKELALSKDKKILSGPTLIVADCIFSIASGVGFLLLIYALMDGMLRLYMLISACAMCIACQRLFSKGLKGILRGAFIKAYTVTIFLLSIALYPLKKICNLMNARLLRPIKVKLTLYFSHKSSQIFTKRKIRHFGKKLQEMSKNIK